MNIGFNATAMITGLFPSPPGAGKGHPFELRAGPFFGGELQVVSLRGRERVNDVYRYEVTFATDQPPELVASVLFGMPACLTIKIPGTDPRVIQGIASSVEALGGVPGEQGSKRRRFRLEIVPRLWLLQHRRQNRIFQNESIPDIVRVVLAGVGIKDADCKWRADRASYPALPFVYQRGETDYELFRRILASAGIFFFYEHASGLLDSMFAGAGAVAGAVGAAAGMLGGAVGSAVSTVESVAGMVPILSFGDKAGHTAAVTAALAGVAGEAIGAGLGALAGAVGAPAVAAVAGLVEEPSDTLSFDDGMGADADYERVFEFALKKELRTKELRMLDRDVEAHQSWVGVASVPEASASLDVSVGLSLGSAGLSASAKVGASFDVDAPAIPAAMLRQEVYQVDSAVWQDGAATGSKAVPAVSLSVGVSAGSGGAGLAATAQAGAAVAPPTGVSGLATAYRQDAATAKRLQMELDRTRRRYQRALGRSDCRRLGAGYRFTLGKHPIGMLNGEYTVTALDVEGTHPDFLGEDDAVYRNRFRCVPSTVAPRPKRPTRRPRPGMEVATVVGYVGGEKLPGLEASSCGYVKVRFRWDVVDERGTPHGSLVPGAEDAYVVWLPLVQPWAGSGFGAQFIPREGMEVLVGFLEDESERPVILGCLHSAANPPPWPEYVDHQKVGIRSRTRPADGGYSEMSIDDRQAAELVTVRAQKDLVENILNDRTATVGHDTTTTVGHDDVLSVTNDRSTTIGANDTRMVRANDTIGVIGDSSTTIGGNVALSVTGKTKDTLVGDLARELKGQVRVTTAGDTKLSFASDYTERHLGHRTVVVGSGSAHRTAALHVEGNARAYASKTMELEVIETLSILCGDSQLLISPKGITIATPTLTLVCKEIDARAGTIAIASTGDLKLSGKTATVQTAGAKMALDGSTASLTGSKVKLGSGSGVDSMSTNKPATVTKVQMKDSSGKPRANVRVLLYKGGKSGEQRMTVLDENGMLELIGDDSYQITFPDDPKAT